MSGRVHGEVLDYAAQLRAAGVGRTAYTALCIVAECVRDPHRTGAVPRGRVADGLFQTGRNAGRVLAQLREIGLIEQLSRGGGRSREGVAARYRVVSIPGWLATRADHPCADPQDNPQDTRMSSQSADREDTRMSSQSAQNVPSIGDPEDISGRLRGHLGVPPSVGSVTEGGDVDDTPAGHPWFGTLPPRTAAQADRDPDGRRSSQPATPGRRTVAAPPHERATAPAAAGGDRAPHHTSVCRTATCRAPEACGACGRARRELAAAEAEQQRAAAAERRARDLAEQVAGRQPETRRDYATMAGWQACRELLAARARDRAAPPAPPRRPSPRPRASA